MALLPGVRFRKSWTIFPGVKINLSKTGISTSIGGHGATVNVGTRSRTVTLGIPGTGLSYRVSLSMTIVLLLVVIAAIVGLAYFIKPDLVKGLLHSWQPRWF